MMRSSFRDQRRVSSLVRLGVVLLAASVALPAVWALLSPQSFFSDFPGLGQHWVRAFPPYNEHLVRDVGSFYLAFAVLMGAAAYTADRRLIRVSLITYLVFSIPHAVWHGQHAAGDGVTEKWGSVVALGAGALLSLVLLIALARRRSRS